VEVIEDADPQSSFLEDGDDATEMGRNPTQGRGQRTENQDVEDGVVASRAFQISASLCVSPM
jgi:hypothetical protein